MVKNDKNKIFKKSFLVLIFYFLLLPPHCFSEEPPDIGWVRMYVDYGAAEGIAVDSHGNVYVTGSSASPLGGYYSLTIKYNSQGDTIWQKIYESGGGADRTGSIAVDSQDNVYVCGYCDNGITIDGLIIKYNSDATIVWLKRYYSTGEFTDIVVDSGGNVYVTGEYFTIKHNPQGDIVWQKTHGYCYPRGIAVDSYGNVYVAGHSFLTKYTSNGEIVWEKESIPRGDIKDIAIDAYDNIYITGVSNDNYFTIKLNSNGDVMWQKEYDSGMYDHAEDIAIDSYGNIYITGEFAGDYLTIKYNSEGEIMWLKRHDVGVREIAMGIAVDLFQNVYVTGYTRGEPYDWDWLTIKYLGKLVIKATVDFDPDTLNKKSNGKWITCYIELPSGYNVANINVSTLKLNGIVPAEPSPTAIGDYDNDEIPDLMVKLDRVSVAAILPVGDNVEVKITGSLNDGINFEGIDHIKVIDPSGNKSVKVGSTGTRGIVYSKKGEKVRVTFIPSSGGEITVRIYTLSGRLVKTLTKTVIDPSSAADNYIDWACKNEEGSDVSSGIYLINIQGPGINITKKVAIMR